MENLSVKERLERLKEASRKQSGQGGQLLPRAAGGNATGSTAGLTIQERLNRLQQDSDKQVEARRNTTPTIAPTLTKAPRSSIQTQQRITASAERNITDIVDSTTGTVIHVDRPSRFGSMVKGAVQGSAAGYANAGGSLLDLIRSVDTANSRSTQRANQEAENAAHYREMLQRGTMDDGTPITAQLRQQLETLAERAEKRSGVYRQGAEAQHAPISGVIESAYEKADELSEKSAENIAEAKEGLGTVGQFAVDVGVAGTQMAGDALIGALLAPVTGGASALAPMAVRGFGSGAQQARQEGGTLGQQLAYGLGSGALSVATERISNVAAPFRKMFGEGVADKLAGKLVSRFGENAAVQTMNRLAQTSAGRLAASALGEGSEEFIEDVFQPVLQRATYDPSAQFDLSEALYDAAVGAALGGVGGAVDIARRAGSDAAGAAESDSAGTGTPGAGTGAEGTTGFSEPTLVNRVRQSIPQIQNMSPVAEVTGAEIPQGGKLVDRLASFVNAIGNKVNRPGFGDVLFSKGRIKNSMIGHGTGPSKIETFAAVPEVIRNGQQIDHQQNWKGRGYDTYTFAAPITYRGQPTYLGVIVTKDNASNRYYLHEVVDANGDVIFRNDESPASTPDGTSALAGELDSVADTGDGAGTTPGTVGTVTDGRASQGVPASDTTIAPGTENVNSDVLAQILFGNAQQEGWQTDGLGNANANSLPSTAFEQMQGKGDTFHPINPAAEQRTIEERQRAPEEVPTQNPDTGRNIQKTVSTILNSPLTSNEMAQEIERGIVDSQFDYAPITDRAAAQEAQSRISARGDYKASADDFIARTNRGERMDKYDFATGIEAYNQAVAAGDKVTAYNLSVALAENAHESAQVLQTMNMFNRLTPEGKLLTLRRLVDKMNQDRSGQVVRQPRQNTGDPQLDFVEQQTGFSISDELATNYLMAETDAERAAAWEAILDNVAAQVPSTFREKANFWRYTMMLLNPTTHARNIAGNAIQFGARKIKDGVGAAIERAVIRDKSQRTKSFTSDRSLREFAREQYQTDQSAAMGGGKYSDDTSQGINREIQNRRKIFSAGRKNPIFKAVQGIGEFNTNLMDAEDVLFNRAAYIDSLAGALKARGITAEQARKGGPEVEEARAYAIQEAQKATYRNTTALSEVVSKMGRYDGTNPVAKALSFFADAELPFRRTPANVLTTGLDYSPVGLSRGIKQALWDVRRGNKTAADAIDLISSGLTGTGIMALGAYLVAEGLLSVGTGDDDREAAYNEDRGKQGYSIRIGDKTYTLDWALPAAMPLFAGASIMESIENEGGTFSALADAMTGISQVVLETSMMSSLDDFITYWSYADNKVTYALDSAVTDYLGQYVPTIGGKIASAFDDTVRSSYVEPGTGQVASDVDYFLQSILKKIPGARNQLQPDIDLWGNERTNGTFEERLFQSFLSPGTLRTVDTSEVDEEIRRLAGEIGDSTIYPAEADKYFTVNGERKNLSAEEYKKYAKTLGKTRYDALSYAFNSPYYNSLTDAEKADIVEDVYTYANGVAKKSVSSGYQPDKWVLNAQQAEKTGIEPGTFIYYRNRLQSLEDSGLNGSEANAALRQELFDDVRLTPSEKTNLDSWIINDLTIIPKDVKVDYSSPETFTITQMSEGAQKRWNNIKNRFGIDAETYQATWKIYQNDDLKADQKRAQMAEYVGGNAAALYKAFGQKLD